MKLLVFVSPGRASESCGWLCFHRLSSKKAEGPSPAAATQRGKKTLNAIFIITHLNALTVCKTANENSGIQTNYCPDSSESCLAKLCP